MHAVKSSPTWLVPAMCRGFLFAFSVLEGCGCTCGLLCGSTDVDRCVAVAAKTSFSDADLMERFVCRQFRFDDWHGYVLIVHHASEQKYDEMKKGRERKKGRKAGREEGRKGESSLCLETD